MATKRTKRQSILVEQHKAGKITVSSPTSIVEVAVGYKCTSLTSHENEKRPGLSRITSLMAITSDQKTYAFNGDNAAKEFLEKFSGEYELMNPDIVLRPSITWLGLNCQNFFDHLRLSFSPHFPHQAHHHLVDFLPYACGSGVSKITPDPVLKQIIKNLYGYELPDKWEACFDSSVDLRLVTEVLSRQKVWE